MKKLMCRRITHSMIAYFLLFLAGEYGTYSLGLSSLSPCLSPFIVSCLSINYPPFWSSLHFLWQFRMESVLVYCRCLLYSRFEVLPNSSCFALQPTWEIADPILSLLGACVVLASTLTVLRDSINILLEGKSKY